MKKNIVDCIYHMKKKKQKGRIYVNRIRENNMKNNEFELDHFVKSFSIYKYINQII